MLKAEITQGNIRLLMNELLSGKGFDNLELRLCELTTNVSYKIDGAINKLWYEEPYHGGCTYIKWADLKKTVLNIIKGNKSPQKMKLVFSLSKDAAEELHFNAAACFLNLAYENSVVTVITGVTQKEFTLDKSLDTVWDNTIRRFLNKICQYSE